VALSLSGGIDSSCLAAALAALDRAVPCYQFAARGEPPQERRLAAAVAAHCRLPFVAVDGGPEVLDALPLLTAGHGLPLGDPSVLAVHALAQAAARDGVRVLLSGEGADELLLGYRRHHAMTFLRRRRSVPAWLLPRWSMRTSARLLRAAAAADAYGELLAASPPGFAAAVLAPELAAEVRAALPAGTPARDLEAVRRHDLEHYLRADLLPKLDVATMAAGVEGRCPYLDRDVVAFALGQPATAVLGKRPLRQAFAAALPAAVFRQPKRGFLLPLDRWFRGELPLLDLLAEPRTQQRSHLRRGGIATVVGRHRQGRSDLGRGLYLLAAYELFLRAAEAQR
jgi:asparagine synthase (glutamine-hydrolysing)